MKFKHILFVSADPGGTDCIIPIVIAIQGKAKVSVYADSEVIERYRKYGIICGAIKDMVDNISVESFRLLLKKEKIDTVVTATSGYNFIERFMWKAAQANGIVSYAILDNWVNYGIRFSNYNLSEKCIYDKNSEISYLPTEIFVMDQLAKNEMIQEKIPDEKIIITGQPYLQLMRERLLSVSEDAVEAYRYSLGCNNEKKLIIYAPDNIYMAYQKSHDSYTLGYDERSVEQELIYALERVDPYGERTVLVNRPHPKDNSKYWNEIEIYDGLKVKHDSNTAAEVMIRAADVIVGMFSIFLIQGYMLDKPIISAQIGLKQQNPFILCRGGVLECADTTEKLIVQLKTVLDGTRNISNGFKKIDAIGNILNIIMEE